MTYIVLKAPLNSNQPTNLGPPSSISIGLVIFAQHTRVTNTQIQTHTDRQTCYVRHLQQ